MAKSMAQYLQEGNRMKVGIERFPSARLVARCPPRRGQMPLSGVDLPPQICTACDVGKHAGTVKQISHTVNKERTEDRLV